jgi:acyl dehydratase
MSFVPRGRYFEEFMVGEAFSRPPAASPRAPSTSSPAFRGDFNPLQTDEESARQGPMKGRIAHGMLVRAMATGQVVVRNQRGETVCQAGWTTLMARRRGAA